MANADDESVPESLAVIDELAPIVNEDVGVFELDRLRLATEEPVGDAVLVTVCVGDAVAVTLTVKEVVLESVLEPELVDEELAFKVKVAVGESDIDRLKLKDDVGVTLPVEVPVGVTLSV